MSQQLDRILEILAERVDASMDATSVENSRQDIVTLMAEIQLQFEDANVPPSLFESLLSELDSAMKMCLFPTVRSGISADAAYNAAIRAASGVQKLFDNIVPVSDPTTST